MDVPLIWIVLLVVLVLFVLTVANFAARTRRKKTLTELRSDWGKSRDRERNMESIAAYHRSLPSVGAADGGLDDRTWEDLDFDAIFQTIDRTESTLGQQLLYHRLRTPPAAAKLHAFEALVMRMEEDTDARQRARMALRRLKDPDGYDLWWLTEADVLERKPWQVVYPLLAAAMASFVFLSFLWPGFLLLVAIGVPVNIVLRGMANDRVFWVLQPFRQVWALLGIADLLDFLKGDDIDPVVGPLQTELPRLKRLKNISRWVIHDPFSVPEPIGFVWIFLNLFFLIDLNAVYLGSPELRRRSSSLLGVINAVGEVDAAISVASFRFGSTVWTRPDFVPAGKGAVLTDLRHPLIEAAVPNTIKLGPPHGVLVTGSNMSGKTTLLRTIGVNVVLAQTTNTCLASAYRAPKLLVESFIGRTDDLVTGKSYYLVEVEGVLARVTNSTSAIPHLFLFDELFRGTNAVERIAAAEAMLTELVIDGNEFKPHFVLAAVHDLELVDLLGDTYSACHFADALGPEGLSFDYKLRMGSTSSRNAIALLGLNGAPDSLVARAEARATALDRHRNPTFARSDDGVPGPDMTHE